MNDCEAGKGGGEVFPLAVLLAGLATAKVGELGDGVKDAVHKGDDGHDTKREAVDTDNGDNVSPATVGSAVATGRSARQPTEKGEHGGEDLKWKSKM